MKKIVSEFFLIIIIAFTLFSSCQIKNDCDSTESLVKIGFYVKEDESETSVTKDSVSVFGVGREDSLLYELESLNVVLIPLSPMSESSAFVFEIGSFIDTITFFYQTKTRFESVECGFIVDFSIDNVYYTENAIDTVMRINKEIKNENDENYRIFFN